MVRLKVGGPFQESCANSTTLCPWHGQKSAVWTGPEGRPEWHGRCSMKQQGLNKGLNNESGVIEAAMKTDINFVQLISSVVGLSLGIGVATATAILGVAALLQ